MAECVWQDSPWHRADRVMSCSLGKSGVDYICRLCKCIEKQFVFVPFGQVLFCITFPGPPLC